MVAFINGFDSAGPSGAVAAVDLAEIENYRQQISGPLLDRIDLHVEVPLVDFRELSLQL